MSDEFNQKSEETKVDLEYKVSELAKLLDLTPETIRYYESVGIINPRHDESNRYRYYMSTEFSRLYNAKLLRSLGFGLSEIKSFFYEMDNTQQTEAARDQADLLKARMEEIKRQLDVLDVFANELSMLDRLAQHSDIAQSESFWLVPFRANYSFDTDSDSVTTIQRFLETHSIPRYSYILRAQMKPGLPCDERYVGYSVRGDVDKPTENAIFVPKRKVIRFSYSLIVGERFDDAMIRCGMYERLREMGMLGEYVEMYGHTINISTKDDVTYLNQLGYIPLGGEPLVDWDAVSAAMKDL